MLHTAAVGSTGASGPFIIEYYYKVRWGCASEFLRLFQKNHYPVLKRQVETGRFLSVTCCSPRYHATEDGRWDFRVTIVFRDLAVAHEGPAQEEAIRHELFPDQDTFAHEEARWFEILLAHWDVPIVSLNLGG